MSNPYQQPAPWVRAITLCVLGAAAFYLLGRWEAAVDRRLEQLRSETASLIDMIQVRRALADSARALEDSLHLVDAALERQAKVIRDTIRSLERADSAAAVFVETAALEDLMPLLQMRPLQIGDTTFYAATGGRVRVLAAGLLRLPIAEERIRSLERLVATELARIRTLQVGWDTAVGRATRAEDALDKAEPLLESWQDYSGCKILGIVSCPSRTTAAVIGAVAGGLTIYVVSRE